MKRFGIASSLVLVALALLPVTTFASAEGPAARYIILAHANLPDNLGSAVEAAGGQLVRTIPQVGIAVATSGNPDFASAISGVSGIASVGLAVSEELPETFDAAELTAPTAADNLYNNGLLWGINRVDAPAAWAAGVTGSHDTVVAVIDTGIAWNHPDLAPNVVFVACSTSAGFWVGAYAPGAPCNPYPSLSDHGTHVSGTVAAAFGGGRVVGVGPNLGLASYNTFENIPGCGICGYSDSRWLAMVDAADRGFDVISMSLGGTGQLGGLGSNDLATYLAAEKRVANYVNQAGTVMVASAGNSALDLNGTIVHVPGDISGIINVSATGIQPAPRFPYPGAYDIIAFYSNYGAAITLAAPGGDCGQIGICDPATRPANWFEYLVLSTIVAPNPACAMTASCPVGYGWKGGTSMATPHVSATAGLIRDVNPGLSPNQVTSILKRTAEPLGSQQLFGAGMVDAFAATQAAMGH
jgi:subtilisin family serine protease